MVAGMGKPIADSQQHDRGTQLACERAPLRAEKQQDQSSVSTESPSSITTPSDWASELAKQLIASKAAPPAGLDDGQRLALAWALKDAAIAAWSSAPSDVVVAAEALGALRGATTEGTAAPSDAEVQAIAAWVKGIADLTRGRMTDAITHLDEATERFRSLGQPGHAAHAQVPKIMALSILGQHRQAAAAGLATQRELISLTDLHAAAKVSLNLGHLYCRMNDYVEALRHFHQAESLFVRVGDHKYSISCQLGAAEAYSSIGEFETALELYSLATLRAQQHELPALLALAAESVALVHLARGQFRDALRGLEDCRQRYESLGMSQNAAMAEKQLGDAYLDLRLLPEALALYDHALARCTELEMPVEEAWTHVQRGRTLATMQRPEAEISACLLIAEKLFSIQEIPAGEAAVLLARAEFALSHLDCEAASSLAHKASTIFATANLPAGKAQSEVISAQALLLAGDSVGARDFFAATLAKARELQLLTIQVRCLVGLGLTAQKSADVETAREAFEAAIALFEEQRGALPSDELRSAFLVDQLRPYEELLRIALNAFDCATSDDAAGLVLLQIERFRARVLGERLGETKDHSSASDANDPDLDLRARLSWFYRRRQKLIDDGEDTQSLTIETRRIERELLERARRRRLTSDANARSIDAVAFDPASLQSALGDGEALIEYGVIDDELFACVVTHERITLQRRLARWPDVVDAIRSARFQIETLRYGAGAVDRHSELLTRRSQTAMRRVHDLVWAPLCPHLAGVTKALVVAHDQLGSLQFAALYDGENYLAETMNLAMAPSAKVALYGMANQPVAAKRALVLGESSRLVHAADEANFVAGLFDNAKVLVGTEANAVALRAACMDADVLHLACHAEFRSDNPMFSALQLIDGPFTVQDAETLQLRQGIVVLSACETGVAVYSRGDEMIGLVRAFLVAGASRVVASLWPVDDAVTLQFMAAFYRALSDGNTASSALRAAQLELMRTHPHPFHWAAFTLYGGW
jgi:tetratricopeptide (TPR) repeat protein